MSLSNTVKILVFGASTSSTSINKKLAVHTAGFMPNAEVNVVDLNDFNLPIFSVDIEKKNGVPEEARRFKSLIEESDGILMSLAEHNGSYTTAFKNLFDWISRLDGETWASKKMLLLSTSPGKRGGASVMNAALQNFPFHGAEISGHFSLPSFYDNFDDQNGILDEDLRLDLMSELEKFIRELSD